MIVAVGIDIIEISRIREVWRKHPERFLSRHFTAREIDFCTARADPLPSLAARFAAKEAFQKCWPENHGWRDVWVVRDGAKPRLEFGPHIRKQIERRQLAVHLSLTHSREHAAAVVVLERESSDAGVEG